VRRDLERRLRAVEVAGSGGIEIWFEQGDGTVCGPHGVRMTREEADCESAWNKDPV
jgi:hypothetical protein